jgi:hypothetical protein
MTFETDAQKLIPRSWVVATFCPEDVSDEQLQRGIELFRQLSGKTISLHDAQLLLSCLEAAREPA